MDAVLGCVEGRVQGVGFRYYTRDCAQALGLTGYVKNLPDGTVEFFVQGDTDVLDKALVEIEKGPEYSKVLSISCERVEPDAGLSDFYIRM